MLRTKIIISLLLVVLSCCVVFFYFSAELSRKANEHDELRQLCNGVKILVPVGWHLGVKDDGCSDNRIMLTRTVYSSPFLWAEVNGLQ